MKRQILYYFNFLLISLVLIPVLASSQSSYTIVAHLPQSIEKEVYLSEFTNVDFRIIDTVTTNNKGNAVFLLSDEDQAGVYRIVSGKDKYSDVIFNYEDIAFYATYEDPDSFRVIKSVENEVYYEYLRELSLTEMKLELLSPVIDYYPPDDDFYDGVYTEYSDIQKRLKEKLEGIKKDHPKSMAYRLARTNLPPYVSPDIKGMDRLEYMKEHYLDNIDFSDVSLVNTNVYANKVISYLTLYSNRRLTQKQLEEQFILAIDKLLVKIEPYPETFEYVIQYLVNGFERYKFEEVLNHIAENYISQYSCENEERKEQMEKRLEAYKKLAIGKKAPPFSIPDVDGNIISSDKLGKEYTLLVFWASWCPHCTTLLPDLKKLYANDLKAKLEIIAVSLDKDRKDWVDFLDEWDFEWISASELKGWQSKIADDFSLYATPTMFLLDKNLNIVAKPVTLRELNIELQELKLL